MSAPVTASSMREYYLARDTDWVWRMLLQGRDHLALIIGKGDQVLLDAWEAEPGSVGSKGWDALLAAIVTHEFETAGLEAPRWAIREPLPEPWMPDHPFLTPERVRAKTPDWLRRQNIYVAARDLVTA